jgi:hypothetical protein
MKVVSTPANYGSAFLPACFTLSEINAPDGIDLDIMPANGSVPLGTKRIYSSTTAQVNVAPYARRLLSPLPLCGRDAGIYASGGLNASCYIAAPSAGFTSPVVTLCGGTEGVPANTLLSAAPTTVTIAPGERDELSIVSEDVVAPVTAFRRGTVSYNNPMAGVRGTGIVTAVVDVDAVLHAWTLRTGAPAEELDAFSVRLKLSQAGYENHVVERKYQIDHTTHNPAGVRGWRLAWLNRFGAIDYHTFPVEGEFRSGGGHTTIVSAGGMRTMSTETRQSQKLMSEPCNARTAEWLSEIFSSPVVWMVDGGGYERVEVAGGEVVCEPDKPTIVSVTISLATANISRNN